MAEFYEILTEEELRKRDLKDAGIELVKGSKQSRRSKAAGAVRRGAGRAGRAGVGAAKYAGRKAKAGAGYVGRKAKEQAAYTLSPEAQEKRKARIQGIMNKAQGSNKKGKQRPQQQQGLSIGGGGGGGWFDDPAPRGAAPIGNSSYDFYWGAPTKKGKKGKKRKQQQQQSWF